MMLKFMSGSLPVPLSSWAELLSFIHISKSHSVHHTQVHQTFNPDVCACVCVQKVNIPSCSLEVSLSRRGGSSLPPWVSFISCCCVLWDCSCWAQDLHLQDSSSDCHSSIFQVVSVGPLDVSRCHCHVPCPWRLWAGYCRPGRRTSCL